ncbi:MAG: hypothetical protein KIS78_29625 [Labilithrix sp.]|nr:hypothetical protein [Labilithrix sp.]MCW5836594.1 hypothetical protein [Labilithrix sp.]
MILGLTRGELLLVAFIFGLIYTAGLLPKIAARLAGGNDDGAAAKSKGD